MNSIAVDAGRLTVAAAKMYPLNEASCEAGSMRGARRSSPVFSNQSARRRWIAKNMAEMESLPNRRGRKAEFLV